MTELNNYSKVLTQDQTQPAAQAMLYGIGLTEADLAKPQVGIASMGYDGNTCNMHLNDLAKIVKQSVWDNELVGLIFNTIGVSDGMSMGTDGMRYSLVSRDLIADSIEACRFSCRICICRITSSWLSNRRSGNVVANRTCRS